MYQTLRCRECSNMDCRFCKIGTYVPEDDERGCTRSVTEEEFATYMHLTEETLPFAKDPDDVNDILGAIEGVEYDMYHSPIGAILDARGKKVGTKSMHDTIEAYNSTCRKPEEDV